MDVSSVHSVLDGGAILTSVQKTLIGILVLFRMETSFLTRLYVNWLEEDE